MSQFNLFKEAVQAQFANMTKDKAPMFVVDITAEEMWDVYLDNFPEGSNPIYRKRTVYDCSCCRHFIRDLGNVVSIVDNHLVSIWDIDVPEPFKSVAAAMKRVVQTRPITDYFMSRYSHVGTDKNRGLDPDGEVEVYEHFFANIPTYLTVSDHLSIPSRKSQMKADVQVFQRSMETLREDAADTVLELIAQGSLYRGDEFKAHVVAFLKAVREYTNIPSGQKDNWCWANARSSGVHRIRNTAIGTLLLDLSADVDINTAVGKFESMVAPANYKRPVALVTEKMVSNAEKEITELGYIDSLERRYATLDDITVNDLLFVDREGRTPAPTVFQDLATKHNDNIQKFSELQEVSIQDFLTNVLPTATAIELVLEHKHTGNLMSVIAPKNSEAPSLLKWDNGFSWTYQNDVADSMKEQVKSAGGKVDGVLRFSIRWNTDPTHHDKTDLDAHCIEPTKNKIFFGNKKNSSTGGQLDIDIMRPKHNEPAVENITWPSIERMAEGTYVFKVHCYSLRGNRGFDAEIEFNGQLYQFSTSVPMQGSQLIEVARVTLKNGEFSIKPSMSSTQSSKEIWGIKTNSRVKVSAIMRSPNHWEGEKKQGNSHIFFLLQGCTNPDSSRGFYNEFLKQELLAHRKVFEILGTRLRAPFSNEQLSGVGFSTTQRNSVVLKVQGAFSRMLRVTF